MFSEEKCPYCDCKDYDIDDYWDDFDEEGGVRVWECTCLKCHKNFDITYEYNFTRVTVS